MAIEPRNDRGPTKLEGELVRTAASFHRALKASCDVYSDLTGEPNLGADVSKIATDLLMSVDRLDDLLDEVEKERGKPA